MLSSEAIKVLKIMATADNWCSTCSSSLIELFGKAFPKFEVIAENFDIEALKEAYDKKNDENIEKDIWETNVWELL